MNFFKLSVTLYFQLIALGFMTMVNAIVLAWKWAMNKLGVLSDEQYKKDKARIQEEQRMRVEGIKKTVAEMEKEKQTLSQGIEWKLRWKNDESVSATQPEKVNPKAPQEEIVNQLRVFGQQKNQTEITIKDQSGKAEVTKNPNNIPIKMTPTIGNF